MKMRVACADITWAGMPHATALEVTRALGFDAVDLIVMGGNTGVTATEVRADPVMCAGRVQERLERAGLPVSDVFAVEADEVEGALNHPDPLCREASGEFFHAVLDFAERIGAPGISILPGLPFDERWEDGIRRSADELRWRLDQAAARGLRLSVEPHGESEINTPDKVLRLLELVPGLELTLDYAVYAMNETPELAVEPLGAYARHIHCRGGAVGRLEASFSDNEINYHRVLTSLHASGYDGFVTTEYFFDDSAPACGRCDVLHETISFYEFLRAEIADL